MRTHYTVWLGTSCQGTSLSREDLNEQLEIYKKRGSKIRIDICKIYETALDYIVKNVIVDFSKNTFRYYNLCYPKL